MLSKVLADKVFMHYFQNMLSASGAFAHRPTVDTPLNSAGDFSSPHSLFCPLLQKSCGSPCVYPQTSRLLPVQRTLSNVAWRPGSSKEPMTDILTNSLLLQLFYQCFYYYHYHYLYHYPYHYFINILCYAPSVFTCIVGSAIYECLQLRLRSYY